MNHMAKTYDILIKEHSNTLIKSNKTEAEKEQSLAELIRIIKHITYQQGYSDGRKSQQKLG